MILHITNNLKTPMKSTIFKIALNSLLLLSPFIIKSQSELKPYFNKTLNLFYFSKDGNLSQKTKFYDYAEPFSEGYAAVRIQNKWEFIDTNLNTALKTEYNEIGSFNNGFSKVWNSIGQCNLINKKGELLFKNFVDEISSVSDHKIAISSNGLWGFANDSGNLIITPQFTEVKNFKNGKTWAKMDQLWFIIDQFGNKISPQGFEQISNIENSLCIAFRSNQLFKVNWLDNYISELKTISLTSGSPCYKITLINETTIIQFENNEYVAIKNNEIIWKNKFQGLKTNGQTLLAIKQNEFYQIVDLNLNPQNNQLFEDLEFYPNKTIKIFIGLYYYFKTSDNIDLIK
jgi:hypothetical protein